MNKMTRSELGRNVYLNYMYTDRFKTDTFTINLIIPLSKANMEMSNLLVRVLAQGSRRYPTYRELNTRCEELYQADISNNVYVKGERIYISFSVNCLSGRYTFDLPGIFDECIDLLGSILYDPLFEEGVFKKSYVDIEKKNSIESIKAKKNNKKHYASSRCALLTYREASAGIIYDRKPEDVEIITCEALTEFYKYIIDNSAIEGFYFGAETEEAVRTSLQTYFDLSPRDISFGFKPMIVDAKYANVSEICEDAAMKQAKLVMSFRTDISFDSRLYPAYSVLLCIFSDSPVSKLFVNVREKLGLCYYCNAARDTSTGVIFVNAGIKNSNFEVARDEIICQLKAISDGNITAEEFCIGQKCLENAITGIDDSVSSLEYWYMIRYLNGAKRISPEEYLELIKKVKPEDVIEAASKIKLDTVYLLRAIDADDAEEDEE